MPKRCYLVHSCIISFLYIKPQLGNFAFFDVTVVLYRFSTSNHNKVISIPLSIPLYYIVSLHQTTTRWSVSRSQFRCIISFLYIKPQQEKGFAKMVIGCIISFLYIKPQPITQLEEPIKSCIISFLYIKPQPDTTFALTPNGCIISFLYIKPQPVIQYKSLTRSCIISFLYIKPQQAETPTAITTVVLYRFSTSNHNRGEWR